ncbi:UDP-N-acetylmuramate dehydrogenase [Helicobacter himalayensis]|uniref:UDP-N-acetylmuramate dehydrogenase n=1 Tax=Helicobacter himalayensis TaxID=1591088 RepID=UPI003D6E2CDF
MQTRCIDFSKYSSLRIGAPIEVHLIRSSKDAQECVARGFSLVGKAQNLLISPYAKNLAMLDKEIFSQIITESQSATNSAQKECVLVGAALSSSKIFSFFKAQNLGGVEFLQGLPGSLGGIIKMNAGLKSSSGQNYEICEMLDSININGEWIDAEKIPFSYRSSGISGVILQARLKKIQGFNDALSKDFLTIRAKHPKMPSCGSCFKNPKGDFAGRLLESVGLKGFSIGGVALSAQHANFLVNLGGGSFEDAFALIELAKKRVFEAFNIMLECEVQIIS